WRQTGEALKSAGFTFFSFLSAIDWLPSPYGKGEDDPTAEPGAPATEIRQGVTGGETRLQVFARVVDLDRHVGVTIKAAVPDDAAAVASWSAVQPRDTRPNAQAPARPWTPAPTGTSASATRCSASASTATPTCATCTCRPASRGSRCAR